MNWVNMEDVIRVSGELMKEKMDERNGVVWDGDDIYGGIESREDFVKILEWCLMYDVKRVLGYEDLVSDV